MGGILVSSNYCKSLILQGEKIRINFDYIIHIFLSDLCLFFSVSEK